MNCPVEGGDGASHCPLCGQPNLCRLADQGLHKGPCWCEHTEFPDELLARSPRQSHCICRPCLSAFRQAQKWHPRPGPGDYYLEDGKMVFTGAYHLRRAYCCGSGCRHCPYDATARDGLKPGPGPGFC